MCPAEARGYIRVRAMLVVQREFEILRGHALLQSASVRARVMESVLERVARVAHSRLRAVNTRRTRRAAA
jgi:hypothetical protein